MMLKILFLSFALFIFAGCRSVPAAPVPFENTFWRSEDGTALCFAPDGNFKGKYLEKSFSGKIRKGKQGKIDFLVFHMDGKFPSREIPEKLSRAKSFHIRGKTLFLLTGAGETIFIFTAGREGKIK